MNGRYVLNSILFLTQNKISLFKGTSLNDVNGRDVDGAIPWLLAKALEEDEEVDSRIISPGPHRFVSQQKTRV